MVGPSGRCRAGGIIRPWPAWNGEGESKKLSLSWVWPKLGSGSQESSASDLLRERTPRNQVITATISTMPRIPAKTEPTIIGVTFLLVVEFTEAMVGDGVSRKPVEVASIEPTILGSERVDVVEPVRTVGRGLAPGGVDDAEAEFEAMAGVGFEELPFVSDGDVGERVGVGIGWGPGLEFR